MILWLSLLGVAFGWLGLTWWWDRPSLPAWQARNRYRLLSFGLLACLVAVTFKALLWHAELVWMIRACR